MAGEGSRRKFEIALLATIVGILAILLLRTMEIARVDVEEAAVQEEAAALRVELLDILVHHETHGGALPASPNPVRWTGRAPVDYLGELDGAPDAVGVWYFDRQAGVLAYRYRRGGEARFRLARAGDHNARGLVSGVGLVRLENDKNN